MNPLAHYVERAKEWLAQDCTGDFSGYVLGKELGIPTAEDRDQVIADLRSLDLIEPVRGKHGQFSRINRSCEKINWRGAKSEYYPMRLPLGLSELAAIRPKNIIIVAGETNAGKTLFALQCAHENLAQHGGQHERIFYFNSEMGEDELRDRLLRLDHKEEHWDGLETLTRTRDFHAAIQHDGLNIIDFLEVSDKFYLVADWISKIHERLTTGVCIICLQKAKGKDTARGGDFTLEKSRLAVALSYAHGVNIAKIVKCKNPLHPSANPQGQEIDYRIVGGARVDTLTPWRWVNEKERKQLLATYEQQQIARKTVNRWEEDA